MLRSVGIHPSAIISHKATISKNALVGPFCVIEDGIVLSYQINTFTGVEIGERVTIEPHVVIKGNTAIGTGSSIFSFSCVGGMPQVLASNLLLLLPLRRTRSTVVNIVHLKSEKIAPLENMSQSILEQR